MTLQVAQEHISDLRRSAKAARGPAQPAPEPVPSPVIALRVAGPDEAQELALIATLDYARPLEGEKLVAIVDGRLVAAISLTDGRVISDPFARTDEAKVLLQMRAEQLAALPRRKRPRLHWRPRFA